MRGGALRHRVDIESKTITGVNDRGQPIYSWTPFLSSIPANIDGLGGRSAEIARQLVDTASHRIVMRRHEGITTKMRIKFEGRIFNIGHIRDIEELHNILEITATEEL